jgi:tetratricopeptide (TPR) repeat protein
MSARRRIPRLSLAVVLLLANGWSPSAAADESSAREAGKHFQRGVALYGEADYRAALVEFKRAYVLSPNASVLYNVGETEYQLQDYAGALVTFERYLGESSPLEPHRGEVEGNVDVLKARVGHVSITTTPPGADVTIDDQAVGKTPLDKAVLVSVGHRRIIASMAGRLPVTRYVDVATDDNLSVSLQLPAQEGSSSSAPSTTSPSTGTNEIPTYSRTGATLRTAGWISTGVLAAGAATFGILALKDASDLKTARDTFPTSQDTLSHYASLTTRYSVAADSLGAAALVLGGITLVSTLASKSSSPALQGSTGGTRVMLGPASARLEVTF